MAAFVGCAVARLSGNPELAKADSLRRDLAFLLGVTVAPNDPNPWGLPTSVHECAWGVPRGRIQEAFAAVQELFGVPNTLALETVGINTIAFEMYEDAILDRVRAEAVVGIGFDYQTLLRHSGAGTTEVAAASRVAHAVRLTPFADELDGQPTVMSSSFGFDYSGVVKVFDDSGEMTESDSLLDWRSLLRACQSADGSLWAIHKVSR